MINSKVDSVREAARGQWLSKGGELGKVNTAQSRQQPFRAVTAATVQRSPGESKGAGHLRSICGSQTAIQGQSTSAALLRPEGPGLSWSGDPEQWAVCVGSCGLLVHPGGNL